MSEHRLTNREFDLLRVALRQVPQDVVGSHLTDDQFICYMQGSLLGEELTVTERHLQSCHECCADLDELFELAGPSVDFGFADLATGRSPSEEGTSAARLGAAIATLIEWLKRPIVQPMAPVHAFAASMIDEVADGGVVSLRCSATDSGELLVTVMSSLPAFAGAEIVLRGGRSVRLASIGAGEYGGELLLSADEWAEIGSETLIVDVRLSGARADE
jgi:hypothetical protein